MNDVREAVDMPSDAGSLTRSPAPKGRGWVGRLVRLAISVGILAWLFTRFDWTQFVQLLSGAHPGWFVVAIVLYVAAQLMSSVRWQILARPLGIVESFRTFVALYFLGMFFNLFLPSSMGGDTVRVWTLGRARGGRPARFAAAALSVLAERFWGLMALLVVACVGAGFVVGQVPLWMIVATWSIGLALMSGILLLPLIGTRLEKARELQAALSLGTGGSERLRVAIVCSLFVQATSAVQIYMLALALGIHAPFLVFAMVVPMITLLTMIPITVNGIGVREGSLVLLLAPVGVAQPQAVALGLLWFLMILATSLAGGVVYLLSDLGSRKEEETHGSLNSGSDQGREGQLKIAA
jgi:uncharacterized membrane protein YbhN (UPF0104 family)